MLEGRNSLIGRLVADRPLLSGFLAACAFVAFPAVSVDRLLDADPAALDAAVVFSIAVILIAGGGVILSAGAPQIKRLAFFYGVAIAVSLTGIAYAAPLMGSILGEGSGAVAIALAPRIAFAALGVFLWFVIASPAIGYSARLSLAGVFGAGLSALSNNMFLARQGVVDQATTLAAAPLATGLALCLAMIIAAEFSRAFARGADRQTAVAYATRQAMTPLAFAILVGLIAFASPYVSGVQSDETPILLLGALFCFAGAGFGALIFTTSSIALSQINEEVAVAENRRRMAITDGWRRIRQYLPNTTAYALVAITVIIGVVIVFETAEAFSWREAFMIFAMTIVAMVMFVSLRTSLLFAALLLAGHIYTAFFVSVFGIGPLAIEAKITALPLTALIVSQITIAWRDENHPALNPKDVVGASLGVYLGVYLMMLVMGAAAFYVSSLPLGGIAGVLEPSIGVARAPLWAHGLDATLQFLISGAIALILSPIYLMAMSARYGKN